MQKIKQVIVIGAGIAGSSAAAALTDCCDVTVLEQESQPGFHATSRSAATWAPFYGPDIIQQLTALSLPLLSNPDGAFSGRPFTSPKGELMLGRDGDEQEIEKHKALGMEPLSLAEAREKVPLIKPNGVTHILYTDQMLDIDVDALQQAYLRHFKRGGGQLHCNATVTALSHDNGQWQVVTATNTFRADVVINAAGAWADHIATLAGIPTVGIQPRRRTAALIPYLENVDMPRWPMVFGAGECFYCTPFGNGLMVSPADETPVEPHDAWPDDIDIARGIDEFQQFIDYDVQRVVRQWAGLRTFAPDGNPVVGFAAAQPGFFWLAGQGGYGIQTSPALASLTRHLICGGNADRGLFSWDHPPEMTRLDPNRYL
jgi:D-arginine dehydrogenase